MSIEVRVPRYIDDPPTILIWSLDEALPVLIGIFMGVMIEQLIICVFLGLVMSRVYRRYQDGTQDGIIIHLLYYIGLYPAKSKIFVNPFAKRFLP